MVDTNILLLYFVGRTNRERIKKFNRTEKFSPEDYDLLVGILGSFKKIVITPNILTEVNSLVNQIGEPERSNCLRILAQDISILSENYCESQIAANDGKFTQFGLTDCGILVTAKDKYLVLTDDLKLANYLQNQQVDAVNFNNLRVYGWE